MSRRGALGLISVTLTGGCLNMIQSKKTEANLNGTLVANVPEGATAVSANDERIASVKPIQDVIELALNSEKEKTVGITISGDKLQSVEEALSKLPKHDPENDPNLPTAYYITTDKNIVRIEILYKT